MATVISLAVTRLMRLFIQRHGSFQFDFPVLLSSQVSPRGHHSSNPAQCLEDTSGSLDTREVQSSEWIYQRDVAPSSPSAFRVLRNTPSQGLMVGDRHIPGRTTVLVPIYTLGRRMTSMARTDLHRLH